MLPGDSVSKGLFGRRPPSLLTHVGTCPVCGYLGKIESDGTVPSHFWSGECPPGKEYLFNQHPFCRGSREKSMENDPEGLPTRKEGARLLKEARLMEMDAYSWMRGESRPEYVVLTHKPVPGKEGDGPTQTTVPLADLPNCLSAANLEKTSLDGWEYQAIRETAYRFLFDSRILQDEEARIRQVRESTRKKLF